MKPKSIRLQLPLSYAGIALLAALLLGGLMLAILRRYYIDQEIEYLEQNAQAISMLVSQMQQDQTSESLAALLQSFAFISNIQVRLLDPDGQVLADSGLPQEQTTVAVEAIPSDSLNPVAGGFIMQVGAPFTDTVFTETFVVSSTSMLIGSAGGSPYSSFAIAVPGDDLTIENGALPIERSHQVVEQPYYGVQGELLGVVELSNGPAYGLEIVRNVAWGWAIAAFLAVLLAAAAGWLVSRRFSSPLATLAGATARMAEGDLSARADISRADEFGALARSFNQMAANIQNTVETLRRFVADAAHELHTPLTALRANLELAEPRPALQQVERLDALTRSLLDLSRLQADTALRFEEVDLAELLREVVEPYASRAEQAGTSFELEMTRDPVILSGEAAQLRMLVRNLLDNALKFTPPGGKVTVTLQNLGDCVQLSVADTGIGIPADDLPRLFSRFHRGRNAAGYPGSGLGLAIVKAIAERHGAASAVESGAAGTRFTIRFAPKAPANV